MSHSISVLNVRKSARADEILDALAQRLNVAHIWPDNAGRAQLWLQLDEQRAYEQIVAALNDAAQDWHEHIKVTRREH